MKINNLVKDMDTEVYLNVGIFVKKSNKSLHKMENEINTAKQTLIVSDL
jgi:hypothetical protein